MNSVILQLPRKNKIRNLRKYDFLPLFYCGATKPKALDVYPEAIKKI